MPSLCRRVWLSPTAVGCRPAELCGWKKVPALDGFLDRLLEDTHAQLEALQRGGRVLLLDPSSTPQREEGPVVWLSLDLAGFSPDDVAVRLDGRRLQVTAKKESQRRAPDGCCARDAREVYREVLLPDAADLEALACALNPDGQLRVEAPRLPPPERVVPIQRLQEAVGEGKQGGRNGGEEAAAEGEK